MGLDMMLVPLLDLLWVPSWIWWVPVGFNVGSIVGSVAGIDGICVGSLLELQLLVKCCRSNVGTFVGSGVGSIDGIGWFYRIIC